jgi:phosphoribosylformimino-5-aminoimidazole carboxamide ribotide isomerase
VTRGTAGVSAPEFLVYALARGGGGLAVGADLKDGFVAVNGWTQTSALTADEFFMWLQALGAKTVICTDISKDGAMRGANLALYSGLQEKYDMNITASGGVSSLEDIRTLAGMGLYGAIVGKAYYTGAIDLREAVNLAAC